MKILINKTDKNILPITKIYDLGSVTTTINDLLNESTIILEKNITPILSIDGSNYLINNFNSTNIKEDFEVIITESDLISLGGGTAPTGIETITGGLVDNTDPSNPVIIDAPSNGTQYARKNGAWSEVEASTPTDLTPYIKMKMLSLIMFINNPVIQPEVKFNNFGATPVAVRLDPGIFQIRLAGVNWRPSMSIQISEVDTGSAATASIMTVKVGPDNPDTVIQFSVKHRDTGLPYDIDNRQVSILLIQPSY